MPKILSKLAAFLAIILYPATVIAGYHSADAITVNVNGMIYSAPCILNIPETVSLGEYNRTKLSLPGEKTPVAPFLIEMTNCPVATSKAIISFSGVPYSESDPGIYANSAVNPAENIGLQLSNLDGNTQVILGNDATYIVDINNETHEAILPIAAQMYTPKGHVTAGNFTAVVTINVSWQ